MGLPASRSSGPETESETCRSRGASFNNIDIGIAINILCTARTRTALSRLPPIEPTLRLSGFRSFESYDLLTLQYTDMYMYMY